MANNRILMFALSTLYTILLVFLYHSTHAHCSSTIVGDCAWPRHAQVDLAAIGAVNYVIISHTLAASATEIFETTRRIFHARWKIKDVPFINHCGTRINGVTTRFNAIVCRVNSACTRARAAVIVSPPTANSCIGTFL